MGEAAHLTALDEQVERLAALSSAELRAEWPRVWDSPTPCWLSDLLRLGIGYKLQEQVHGGLKPGTQLVRSWHGRTVSVVVTEAGFTFEDRAYASLTAIAKEVTGVGWSGPQFFGLKERGRG